MAGRGKGGKGKVKLMGNVFVPVNIQESFTSIVNAALKFHSKIFDRSTNTKLNRYLC